MASRSYNLHTLTHIYNIYIIYIYIYIYIVDTINKVVLREFYIYISRCRMYYIVHNNIWGTKKKNINLKI